MHSNFTEGKIFSPLFRFAVPIMLAMFLQMMYGAVDLLIVGQFGTTADVSAVATGGQVMLTVTSLINGLAMGLTILVGHCLGRGAREEAGHAVGSGMCIFLILSLCLTALLLVFVEPIARIMHAPARAFAGTVQYISICAGCMVFLVAYNMIGAIFRGLGDAKTPLLTVGIACVINIVVDLILVAGFGMGVVGAAWATVFAQALSVVLSLRIIQKQGLPFAFSRKSLRFHKGMTGQILKYGLPIATQDGFVNLSFLAITMIVNSLGEVPSAAVGISEKLAGFVMLLPMAFSQAIAAFSAQNFGAGLMKRARQTLYCGLIPSVCFGFLMGYVSFFQGDFLAGLFSTEAEVIFATWDYMKAYAFDCLLTCFMFAFLGFFSGCGRTSFVMVQGVVGAFLVRIPVSYWMSQTHGDSLFAIGLASPTATVIQLVLCVSYFLWFIRRMDAS